MRKYTYDPGKSRKQKPALKRKLSIFLAVQGRKIAKKYAEKVGKADLVLLVKTADEIDEFARGVGDITQSAILAGFGEAYASGIEHVLGSVDTRMRNAAAEAYAKARAAELVTEIADSTRQRLRGIVATSVDEGEDSYQLADRIVKSQLFSAVRADLIASYELGTAYSKGNLEAWKDSGVVSGKGWQTAEDDIVSDECRANQDQGVIGIDEQFQSGDDAPLAHPMCRCTLYGAGLEG